MKTVFRHGREAQHGTVGGAGSEFTSELTREEFWWLLVQVGALSRRVAERRLAASSTSPDQVQALRAIGSHERMTVGELAHAMGLERNSASQLAERLVQQNLIERVRSTSDRRQVLVALSEGGREVLQASEPDATGLAGELLVNLSSQQIAESARVLEMIRDSASRVLHGVPRGR